VKAVNCAQRLLSIQARHEECSAAIQKAVDLAGQGSPIPEKVETLGAGWVAEEALAISVYCALVYENDYSQGTLLAVNHGGDSDSTGCITGHILGCRLGISAVPQHWVADLELSDLIKEISTDLWIRYLPDDAWYKRYPGW
jgi:ADP-ribosylglycohydrolase